MLREQERLQPGHSPPDSESLPDEDLVRLAQDDRNAFGILYRRYLPEITSFIRARSGGNDDVADDIASTVFTKALAALPRYTTGPFRAWLYRIARNTLIDEYRKRRPDTPIDIASEIADGEPSPQDHAIAADAARRLYEAIDTLKPDQQAILQLRLHGWSIAEIAAHLDMTENAVKSTQYRAFVALRQHPGVQR